jgi:hypothetical protein
MLMWSDRAAGRETNSPGTPMFSGTEIQSVFWVYVNDLRERA